MKYYITTPIYYATAKPHLGSLYSTVLADVACRWHQMLGYQTFFLTGTDEHGQKIASAAAKLNLKPQELLDQEVPAYKDLWQKYEINYTKFIRTTEQVHKEVVQKWLLKLVEQGQIYKDSYKGWYCTPCETFVKDASPEAIDVACTSCLRPAVYVSEEAYFFRLSAYQDRLLEFFAANPNFIMPQERLMEVVRFVESGLKDLCVSRATVSWGIEFPNDPKQTVYVWADALSNYITAIGYLRDEQFAYWWPADIHIMGKDIVRFHAVYWLAFLMALDLPLPRQLLVHGWIKVGEQKMSKSLGNTVDPVQLANQYGSEQVRYYLASQLAINHDAEFSIRALENCINSDLVNGIGILLNRAITLAFNHDLKHLSPQDYAKDHAMEYQQIFASTIDEILTHWNKYHFHQVISGVQKMVDQANRFFHQAEPWKVAKNDRAEFVNIMAITFNSLRVIGHLLWPFMPCKMVELLSMLQIELIHSKDLIMALKDWRNHFVLTKAAPLFEKIEIKMFDNLVETKKDISIENSIQKNSQSDAQTNLPKIDDLIEIADFAKCKIVIGTILSCENVEKSDKLVLMKVDCGEYGIRQILSGVRPFIMPADLINKQALFVVNLKPRKVMGYESQGMMLSAASLVDEKRVLNRILVTDCLPNGANVG
jgi:methionyl-tRNA synthetase